MTRGFLTLELIIAIALFATIMTAALLVAFGGQVGSMDVSMTEFGLATTSNKTQLLSQAASVHQGFQALAGSVVVADGFRLSTLVDTLSPCIKYVEASTTWSGDKGRALVSSSGTLVISTTTVREMGGTCSPLPPGNWQNPGRFNGFDSGGPQGNAIQAAYINGVRYALVVSDSSNGSQDDFWVLDTTAPDSLSLVASLDTGRGDNNILGLHDIAYAHKTAYVVRAYKENVTGTCKFNVLDQLQVIDLSDPTVPVLQPTDISFDIQGVDPCGSDPDGKVIRYWDGKIYVGMNTTLGPELLIYDVSGVNRLTPVFIGKLYDAFNHSVNDIVPNGQYVYLATGHDDGEVYVVHTGNLSAATPVNLTGTLDATALYKSGNRLYAGRNRATGSNTDFEVLNISTPASPTVLGPGFKLGQGSGAKVTAVSVHGPFAFVSSTDSNSPLFILNITDPNALVRHVLCTLNWSQVTTGMVYIDNMLLVVNRSNDMVRVVYDQPGSCS